MLFSPTKHSTATPPPWFASPKHAVVTPLYHHHANLVHLSIGANTVVPPSGGAVPARGGLPAALRGRGAAAERPVLREPGVAVPDDGAGDHGARGQPLHHRAGGKSTLVSRFVLQRAATPEPFVCVKAERPLPSIT